MKKQFLIILLTTLGLGVFAQRADIIPQPVQVETKDGTFTITEKTKILFNSTNQKEKEFAELATELLKDASGKQLKVVTPNDQIKGNILIQLNNPFDTKLGNEGYKLSVKNDRIFLNANTTAGLFYGVQSMWQQLTAANGTTLPCMNITDYPRFGWRGMHLDVSRHFMPVKFIYKFIDYIAMHKMNVFHWHLVDDQGWRIEIKKYPKLTEVGAWRADREHLPWDSRKAPLKGNETKYGGFYSQKEVKDIVAYAQSKNVTIMPEIEMPAHVMSGLAAYPEYSCTGEYQPVPSGGVWPITHIFCAGKEKTFGFLEDVLTEVMELFPSTYIHIGGDEATKTEWKKCELCQKRMKEEGLKDEHELQAWFIKRIEKFLNSKGRQLVGWDEILEGGLNPSATIMSWRGSGPGIEAAKLGHPVIMTPGTHCYFDHYQGNPDLEPKAWGGYNTLKNVYHYEPIPEKLTEQEGEKIMGAQGNIWTEYMPDGKQVEYMIMPRMAALAEALWSPVNVKDWEDFSQRMENQYKRYKNMGANVGTSAFQVSSSAKMNPENKIIAVELSSEAWQPDIRYTTDGTEPTAASKKYTEPFSIDKTTTVKAVTEKEGQVMSKALGSTFYIHKAVACPVSLKIPNSKYYPSSGEFALVNGIKGSKNHGDKKWLGFNGKDMIATVDLGSNQTVSKVSVGFLQNSGAWIFFPTKMTVEVSADGKNFKNIGTVKNKIGPMEPGRLIQNLTIKKKTKAQYIRVTANVIEACPKGHGGEGKPGWLFVDEIVVE